MRWRRHKSGFCAHTCVFPVVLGSLQKDADPNVSHSGWEKPKLPTSGAYCRCPRDTRGCSGGSPPSWWCSRCLSWSGGRGKYRRATSSAHPPSVSACRTKKMANKTPGTVSRGWLAVGVRQKPFKGLQGADGSCNTGGTFQKTESKSAPWNLSGIPAELSLGPSNVTNSSNPTWPSPAEERQEGHEGGTESRLRARAYRLYPGAGWWPPAPPRWACTPASAWPSPAPAWRWTRYHPGQTPWTPHGSLLEKPQIGCRFSHSHLFLRRIWTSRLLFFSGSLILMKKPPQKWWLQ